MTSRTYPVADLGSEEFYAANDPTGLWRRYVADDAMVWTPPSATHNGFWSVFSHRSCMAVLAADAPFTSEYGMFIGFDRQRPDAGSGRMIVVSEGEVHDRLRRVMGSHLARATAGPLARVVARELDAFVAAARERAVSDAAALGSALPNTVVCELLGVPASDHERLRYLTQFAVGAPDDPQRMSPSVAHLQIMSYFADLVRHRRRVPGDDLVSHLLGNGMTEHDALINCDNVFAAGNATTQHSVTGAFDGLAGSPGALEVLRADPAAVRTGVEEVLRWSTPGPHVLRVALRDTVVAGRPVAADTAVVSWLAAANRDARAFPDPDRFDIRRRPNRHLSFGHGLHYCLGAALARLELRMLLESLAEHVTAVHHAGEPERLRATKVNGYRRLPVSFEWRD
ncbi:cytochrome P450 [Streptomyces sp. CS149]|uniref:cytochrome P450 n=1 Tax=Streptomyces sp. CS149 TaxID=2109332 RepID=UPI000D19A949|nr:cytochrome P450 [Streptomyces sp. CS149]PSK68634.1 cytochrome P450 [Streptomyces sp. CS149]